MNALRVMMIVMVLAILAGCAGVERKPDLDECIADVLKRDDTLRGINPFAKAAHEAALKTDKKMEQELEEILKRNHESFVEEYQVL